MKLGRRQFLKGLLMAGPAVAAAKVLPAVSTAKVVPKSTDLVNPSQVLINDRSMIHPFPRYGWEIVEIGSTQLQDTHWRIVPYYSRGSTG